MSKLHEHANSLDSATTLRDRLNAVYRAETFLDEERRRIFEQSLVASQGDKVMDDDDVAWMLKQASKAARGTFEFKNVAQHGAALLSGTGDRKTGSMVAIRPCDEACKGKTFLGLLLGDIAQGFSLQIDRDLSVLHVSFSWHNPAIWVPELDRVVYGMESWWGPIRDETQLHQITDQDIQNVWYVKAMRQIHENRARRRAAEPAEPGDSQSRETEADVQVAAQGPAKPTAEPNAPPMADSACDPSDGQAHPAGEVAERCDQCGTPRQCWQDAQDTRCPNHALPEPYSSCDGTLRGGSHG
jgi:hypothetical protein